MHRRGHERKRKRCQRAAGRCEAVTILFLAYHLRAAMLNKQYRNAVFYISIDGKALP